MSLPILIKPLSFRLGLFYYFRFALKGSKFYITIIIFLFFSVEQIMSQEIDSSFIEVNNSYDSLLNSDVNTIDKLFYKHSNNVLINNIGPFGSHYYFPTTYFLFQKELIKKKDDLLIKYYKLKGVKPFTNISYLNASRKEQIISIKHIQQLGKQLKFNFDLKKVSSPGAYQNQEVNNTLFKAELAYQSKNNNYEISFNNVIQRDFFELNGGLFDVLNFENKLSDNERNYQVNLATSNSYLKRYKYILEQRLDLFKVNAGSSNKQSVYIKHNTNYQTKTNAFFDNEARSSIYSSIFIDSVATVDSIYSNNISNTGFIGFRSQKFFMEGLYQYDAINYFQSYGLDTNFQNSYIGIVTEFKEKKYKVEAILKYGVGGYRKEEVLSEIDVERVSEKFSLKLKGGYFLTQPDLKFVNYTSNHFDWKNYGFDKQSLLKAKLDFEWIKPQLEFVGETKLIDNAFYYDTLAQANQFNGTLSMTSLSLSKKYKLLNFYFKTALVYQSTSNKNILPLPEIVGRQIAYYQKHIFKKALKIQLGVGVTYSTEYYGYAFMPALQEFYVQENKKLGYYPSVDVFLNTHLKRAQIFLKYEHINAGGSLSKSYLAPNYPELNKSLKFGVSWNLFD